MKEQEVTGLAHFPKGCARIRELTVGEMRQIRRKATDDEEKGMLILSSALLDPAMTIADLDALPMSATSDLVKLTRAVVSLQTPEGDVDSPPA